MRERKHSNDISPYYYYITIVICNCSCIEICQSYLPDTTSGSYLKYYVKRRYVPPALIRKGLYLPIRTNSCFFGPSRHPRETGHKRKHLPVSRTSLIIAREFCVYTLYYHYVQAAVSLSLPPYYVRLRYEVQHYPTPIYEHALFLASSPSKILQMPFSTFTLHREIHLTRKYVY